MLNPNDTKDQGASQESNAAMSSSSGRDRDEAEVKMESSQLAGDKTSVKPSSFFAKIRERSPERVKQGIEDAATVAF